MILVLSISFVVWFFIGATIDLSHRLLGSRSASSWKRLVVAVLIGGPMLFVIEIVALFIDFVGDVFDGGLSSLKDWMQK